MYRYEYETVSYDFGGWGLGAGNIYSIEDYHYGLHVLYLDLFNQITGDVRDSFGFLFASTPLPAMSRAVRMGAAELELHRRDYKASLVRFSTCWASGDWGSPILETRFYVPTRAEAKRFALLANDEEF